jgi:hypothetical protein
MASVFAERRVRLRFRHGRRGRSGHDGGFTPGESREEREFPRPPQLPAASQ